jgi:hypothetical protein
MSAPSDHGRVADEGEAPTRELGAVIAPLGRVSPSGSLQQLRRRRLELAERVSALTWDLGGLTYEMAIRDHYRLDVLARRAAELQQADAELGELQRLLRRGAQPRRRLLLALRRTADARGPAVRARRAGRQRLRRARASRSSAER